MHRLQELVRLHRQGTGARKVARLLKMSPNTERRFRRQLQAAGLLEGDPEELPELEVLQAACTRPDKRPPQEVSSVERWRDFIEEKLKKGHGPKGIHEVLTEEQPDFAGSLSAVKRLCVRIKKEQGPRAEDVAIPVVTAPGEIAQVDFGYVGKLFDPDTGRKRKAWVFVMVLGCSRHLFAKVVFDQKATTWVALHREAFEWFGGVPRTLVPDNLKAAVIRAAFAADEVSGLQRSYRELARHYGFIIDPTPPYSPEKKGKVESAVRYVKRSFFGPRDFDDAQDANRRLAVWVAEVAGQRTHGTTGQQPLEAFEAEERAALQPLPPRPYAAVVWKQATVRTNSHVTFEGAFWSVPWRHLGATAMIRATRHTVEIYVDECRVATHARRAGERWHTVEDHLPEGRRDLRHRSRGYWEERADALGEEVGAYIREVFDADDVQRPIRRVAAILRRLEAVEPERAAAACVRASFFACYSAGAIGRILRDGLDGEPLPATALSPQWASQPRYARSATSFLAGLEVSHGTC